MSRRRQFRLARTALGCVTLISLVVFLVSSHGSGRGQDASRSNGVRLSNTVSQHNTVSQPHVRSSVTLSRRTATAAAPDTGAIPTGNPLVRSPMTVYASACADVAVAREVIVSISMQRLFACDGEHLAMTTLVTTGSVEQNWATPLGTWKVYAKQTDRWLSGPGYSDYVHYWMPFFGNYGIHDATWQTFPYGSSLYRTEGSHGCVQVPLAAMGWLYSWAPVATVVQVVS